jgi:hypothetical protein
MPLFQERRREGTWIVFYLGALPDVDGLSRQFSAQEQIEYEQGVQGDRRGTDVVMGEEYLVDPFCTVGSCTQP